MVIRVSSKDIHRYKYTKSKIRLKRKNVDKTNISFGDIYSNIQVLKEKGIISVSSVSCSISKVMKEMNYKNKNYFKNQK